MDREMISLFASLAGAIAAAGGNAEYIMSGLTNNSISLLKFLEICGRNDIKFIFKP